MPAALLPDIEQVITQWLATIPDLSGVVIGTRVPLDYDGSQKVIRVVRLGGGADFLMRFDHPRLDIDVFGPDQGTTSDLLALVRRLLLVDIHTANLAPWGAAVSDVRELVGPQWLDEPNYPNAGRYLIQITAMVHAL